MENKSDNRSLRQILAPMSRKEKINYLWSYYKWVPIALLAAIAVLCSVIGILAERSSSPLLSGVVVNLPVTESGEHYLTDTLFLELGGDPEEQHMDLQSIFFHDLLTTNDPSADQAMAMKVTAKVTARSLDYVLMDEVAYNYYKNQDVFSPLEEVLTAQQLEQYSGRIVLCEGVPLALELSGSDFAENYLSNSGKIYLAFPGNTENTALCIRLAEFLLNES